MPAVGLSTTEGDKVTASTAATEDERFRPLTVQGLIEVLVKFQLDTPVVVDGYEEGFEQLDTDRPSTISMRHKPDHADWEGEYEDTSWTPSNNDLTAVRIGRRSH